MKNNKTVKILFPIILLLLLAVLLIKPWRWFAETAKGVCTLTIDASDVLSHAEELTDTAAKLPPDGYFADAVTFAVEDGETAYSLLRRYCDEKGLSVEGEPSYVTGIGGLLTGDAGAMSGWLYTVNGELLWTAASEYMVQDGDAVCFVYDCTGSMWETLGN